MLVCSSPRTVLGHLGKFEVSLVRRGMKFTLKSLSVFRPSFNVQIEQCTLTARMQNAKYKRRQIVFITFWYYFSCDTPRKNFQFSIKYSQKSKCLELRAMLDIQFFSLNWFPLYNVGYVMIINRLNVFILSKLIRVCQIIIVTWNCFK